MPNTLQRLKQFIDSQPFSMSSFEKHVGFSNGSLSSQIKNNKTIGVDKLEHILKLFPNLSSDWLLKGEGEMLRSDGNKSKNLRHQNIVRALTDVPSNALKITPRQRFIAEDNYDKLYQSLKNTNNEFSGLVNSLEQLEILRDFTDEFCQTYTDPFFNALFNTSQYLQGNKFDYDSYKAEVILHLDKLKDFSEPIKQLVTAFHKFLIETKPFDSKNIFDEYISQNSE
ncbi:MAG TPA: hypothetical protein VHE59_10450 [Mucilaginibacter sp.]|nr:hypothetical protein [Mucilaginibacter sp.]